MAQPYSPPVAEPYRPNLQDYHPPQPKEATAVHTTEVKSQNSNGESPLSRLHPLVELGVRQIVRAIARLRSPAEGNDFDVPDTRGDRKSTPGRPWKPMWIRFGPLSGLTSMFLALASIAISLAIVHTADGSPTDQWAAPPSTYLAIAAALANLMIRYACIQGVIIAWWCRAMRGSSLAKLHWDWRAGTTLRGAITSGRHVGLLGIACIFSTIVVIDGVGTWSVPPRQWLTCLGQPLLQRSVTVGSQTLADHPVTLNVNIAPELPRGFSGYWYSNAGQGLQWRADPNFNETFPTPYGRANQMVATFGDDDIMSALFRAWSFDEPFTGLVHGCIHTAGQRCRAKVRAPAFQIAKCSTQVFTTAYHETYNGTVSQHMVHAFPLKYQAFFANLDMIPGPEEEQMVIMTGHSQPHKCRGELIVQACAVRAAIGEYDVEVERNTTTFLSPGAPVIVSKANNTNVNISGIFAQGHSDNYVASTIGGLSDIANARFQAAVTQFSIDGTVTAIVNGMNWLQFVRKDDASACKSFNDPQAVILNSLNRLMVYAGVYAARENHTSLAKKLDPGVELNATITGQLEGQESVFRTDYGYFIAASLVQAACVLLILPTYWGWWTLGRPVSFSPLEIAKARTQCAASNLETPLTPKQAFEAPSIADCDPNATGRELARATADRYVQYGAGQASDGSGKRFAFCKCGGQK